MILPNKEKYLNVSSVLRNSECIIILHQAGTEKLSLVKTKIHLFSLPDGKRVHYFTQGNKKVLNDIIFLALSMHSNFIMPPVNWFECCAKASKTKNRIIKLDCVVSNRIIVWAWNFGPGCVCNENRKQPVIIKQMKVTENFLTEQPCDTKKNNTAWLE